MSNFYSLIIVKILYFCALKSIYCNKSKSSQVVYSPFYLNKINFSKEEGVPLRLKVANDINLVFIAAGFGGIAVMDLQGKEKLFSQQIDGQYINPFDVTNDGRILMIGLKQKLAIYEFINPLNLTTQKQQFVEVGSSSFPTEIQDMVYQNNTNIVVAAGMSGEVVVYDVTAMNDVKQLSKYNTQSLVITGVYISHDSEWIYLGCDIVGVVVLRLNLTDNINLNQVNNNGGNSQKNRKANLILAAVGAGSRKSWSVIVTKDFKYIFEIENWFGLYYGDFQQVITSQVEQYPIQIKFDQLWPFESVSPTCYILMLSNDNTLLFVGARSQGVFIFDISQPNNFRFYQQIQIDALAASAVFSKTEQYLYYANSINVQTFLRVDPNLNEEYPNLFNSHQAIQNDLGGLYKWRCYIEPTNQYMIGAFDYSGLHILPFYDDPTKIDTSNPMVLNIEADSANLDNQGKYLYIPSLYNTKLITVLQIKPDDKDILNKDNISILNPKEVYSFNINTTCMSEQLVFNKDRQYAISTYSTGIILFNTTNPLNFIQIFHWINPSFMAGENQGGMFTKDDRWIIGTVRNYGIYVLDIKDKQTPFLTDYIETRGGEGIEISEISDDFAYFMDGMQGFAIINLKSLPKINIISRISLPGWTQVVFPLYNETYILIGSMEDGMLTLLNIKDKYNPKKISSYRREKQYAVSICGPKSGHYMFIANPQGVISLPLVSKVSIHTEVSELVNSNIVGSKMTIRFDREKALENTIGFSSNEYLFRVGQSIQLNFVVLYPEYEDMRIIQVNVYENDQVLEMPYYMKYDYSTSTLNMFIDKLSLGEERENAQLNTILIKTVIPLQVKQFHFLKQDKTDQAVTTMNQAQLIMDYLMQINLLDNKRTVTSFYDPNKKIILDETFLKTKILKDVSEQDYLKVSLSLNKKIRLTLMKSLYINPVIFYVLPSLAFDQNHQKKSITSLSQTISALLIVDKKVGRFVTQDYPGVISSTSEAQDQIKFEGSLEGINKILEQKIIFANNTELIMDNLSDTIQTDINNSTDQQNKNSNTPKLTITISDNINYPIIQTIAISKCKFIVLKKQLILNTDLTLQQQIDKQFPDSTVYIESEISIAFADNTFFASDAINIKYKLQLQYSDKTYQDLSPNFWLQSQGDTRNNYRGNVPTSAYLKVYNFRVNATDGYTHTEDYFVLKVYGIPFLYIFNLLVKILGPLFAVLGIYKERSIILNMIFKKIVSFDDEVIQCNSKYCKKIVLLGNVISDSKVLVNLLFDKIEQQLIYKRQKSQQGQYDDQMSNNSQMDVNNPQQGSFIIDEINNKKKIQQEKIRISNKVPAETNMKKTINQLEQLSRHIPESILEKTYLKPNGSLSMTKIVQDILKFKFTSTHRKQMSTSHDYTSDMKNINSKIYRGVRAQAARYFLSLNKRSQLVYEFIKDYSYQNLHKSQNDWYKGVIFIKSTEDTDNDGIQITFPLLSIRCENLAKILVILKILPSNMEINSSLCFKKIVRESENNNKEINFYLIREVLFADALGFSQFIPSLFQPAVGESIHLNSYDVKQIIAFKKGNYRWWTLKIVQFFNQEYQRYGVSKNIRIPTWLQLDQKHGILIFYGIPSTEDIEEFLIRIYDTSGYVIKQFHIQVVQNPDSEEYKGSSMFSVPNEVDNETNYQYQSPVNKNRGPRNLSYFQTQQNSDKKRQKFSKSHQNAQILSPDISLIRNPSELAQSNDTINIMQNSFLRPMKQPSTIQFYEFTKNKNSKNSNYDTTDEIRTQIIEQNILSPQSQHEYTCDTPLYIANQIKLYTTVNNDTEL